MSLPESTLDKIKHGIFHILNIPVHAIESTKTWVEKEGSKLVIKIETDINNVRKDWQNNVNYIKDVTNKADGTRIYTFRIPAEHHSDLETLHQAITTYNLGQKETVEKIADKLKKS